MEVSDFCFMVKNKRLKKVRIIRINRNDKHTKTYNLSEIANSDNYFVNGILVNSESETKK